MPPPVGWRCKTWPWARLDADGDPASKQCKICKNLCQGDFKWAGNASEIYRKKTKDQDFSDKWETAFENRIAQGEDPSAMFRPRFRQTEQALLSRQKHRQTDTQWSRQTNRQTDRASPDMQGPGRGRVRLGHFSAS